MKSLLFIFLISGGYAFPNDFLPESFSAEFTQEFKSTLKGKIKKSKGKIVYKYPSQIRFEVTEPDKVVYVSNQEKSWYYQAPFIEGEPGELNIRKTGKIGLSRFFDILKKGLKTNQYYEVKSKSVSSELKFSEKVSKELDIKSAVLIFKNKKHDFDNVEEVQLTYLDDHKIKLKFTKIVTKVPLKKDHFIFKVPKNTRINQ